MQRMQRLRRAHTFEFKFSRQNLNSPALFCLVTLLPFRMFFFCPLLQKNSIHGNKLRPRQLAAESSGESGHFPRESRETDCIL